MKSKNFYKRPVFIAEITNKENKSSSQKAKYYYQCFMGRIFLFIVRNFRLNRFCVSSTTTLAACIFRANLTGYIVKAATGAI